MSADTSSQRTELRSRSNSHRSRSGFGKWLERVRKSRTTRRKLINILVVGAFVLIAFLLGFYYFGPTLSSGE